MITEIYVHNMFYLFLNLYDTIFHIVSSVIKVRRLFENIIYYKGLFSSLLSLNSSLNVRDHVSQPYNRTSNMIVLYISITAYVEKKSAEVRITQKYK